MGNEALKDIEKIIETRPELTEEEWLVVEKASDWIKAQQRPQVRAELDAEYADKFQAEVEAIRKEQAETIKTMMQEWKDEQKPLEKDDLQMLLSQEYVTFKVPVQFRHKDGITKKEFTLCELPLEVEKRFIASAKTNLIPIIEKINALEWTARANWSETLQKTIETMPEALDVAAELTSICLNPWGEDEEITTAWVIKHISTVRIVKILRAQVEVNKYRDFFSGDFQLFRR